MSTKQKAQHKKINISDGIQIEAAEDKFTITVNYAKLGNTNPFLLIANAPWEARKDLSNALTAFDNKAKAEGKFITRRVKIDEEKNEMTIYFISTEKEYPSSFDIRRKGE